MQPKKKFLTAGVSIIQPKKNLTHRKQLLKNNMIQEWQKLPREKKSLRKLGMTLTVRKRNMTVALQLLHRRRSYLRSFWQAGKRNVATGANPSDTGTGRCVKSRDCRKRACFGSFSIVRVYCSPNTS